MTKRKVVITGGTGFIDGNLAEGPAADNSVMFIDSLSADKKEDLTNLLGENVKFVEGSTDHLSPLKRLFKKC